jgi:hypothetical protein
MEIQEAIGEVERILKALIKSLENPFRPGGFAEAKNP